MFQTNVSRMYQNKAPKEMMSLKTSDIYSIFNKKLNQIEQSDLKGRVTFMSILKKKYTDNMILWIEKYLERVFK